MFSQRQFPAAVPDDYQDAVWRYVPLEQVEVERQFFHNPFFANPSAGTPQDLARLLKEGIKRVGDTSSRPTTALIEIPVRLKEFGSALPTS